MTITGVQRMKARRLLLKVVLAVMPSSCLLRFTSISSQAFSTDTLRTVATRLTRQSSRTPLTLMTCHKRCTCTISRWTYSERPRQLPRPRPRRPHRPAYISSSLSISFGQDPPSEKGGSSSSSTSKLSSPSEPPQTGPRVLGGSGEGFGAISTGGEAGRDGSRSSPARQQSQRERRPKQQPQRRPRAPPRGNNLLIVGLGNPGEQYRRTRHNAGFLVAEELARRHGGTLKIRTAFQGEYCSISFKGKSIGILRPVTYMNHSGMAARKVMDFFKLPMNAALVLVDEVALDFGKLRLKEKGSPGGHNGLKSIQAHLKTQDYNRLRIGIGACSAGPLSDHVLGEFTRSEKKELDSIIAEACDAVEYWIEEEDTAKVMTRFNG